jgi:nucleoside-diphosphate-sugar epimerase
MKIVVIGGAGFIGQHLVTQLIGAGHEVTVMRRPGNERRLPRGVRSIAGDRRELSASRDTLRAERPDVVIDLILSSGQQARDLLDVFTGYAGRLVVATSCDVYRAATILHHIEGADGELEPVPLTESSRLRTVSQTYPEAQIAMLKQIFGWLDDDYDKLAVERVVQGSSSLGWTILRLPMIYGPGDRLHRLWAIVKRIRDGRAHIILPAGFAGWRSPRGYVENVAAAVGLAATDDRATDRVFNVAEPESLCEREWTELVAVVAGWRGRIVVLPDADAPPHLLRPANFAQHWSVDSSRIRGELGYAELVSREDAIRRSVEWELANAPANDPEPVDYAAEDRAISKMLR